MPSGTRETLRDRLRAGALLSHTATGLAVAIARHLAELHAQGVVHGALKPECVVIERDGAISLIPDTDAEPLVADYTSPEQVNGEPATPLSDIFSFGVIFYEMLSGARPFLRQDLVATCRAIREEWPAAPPTHVPPALERMAQACLRKKPADRVQSAADLAFIIEAFGGLKIINERRRIRRQSQARVFLAAVACAFLGAVAGAYAARAWLRPSITVAPAFRSLTYSGRDSSPAVSPDGGLVAFSSDRDGTPRIWLYDTKAGTERVLTGGPDREPRFSPDGQSVVFIRDNAAWRVGISGGEPVQVLDNVTYVDWSPRGNELAWIRPVISGAEPTSSVGVSRIDGTGSRELTRLAGQVLHHPRWSPDGSMIAVSGASVMIVKPDGAIQRYSLAMSGRGSPSAVVWSSDQRYVMYLQSEGGTSYLIRQNAVDGADGLMGYSPYGGNVLDAISPSHIVLDGSIASPVVFATKAGGDTSVLLHEARDPFYCPRGILFGTGRGIFEMESASGLINRLIEDRYGNIQPIFGAARLFWASNHDGHYEIWTAGPDGSNPKPATHDGGDARQPSVSADGAWLVYTSFTPSRRGIWKIRLNGLDDIQLALGDAEWPDISPDGKYVLYTQQGKIKAMTIDGAALPFSVPGARARWVGGSNVVAYSTPVGIYVKEINGTGAGRLWDSRRNVESFSVSSDGKSLLVGVNDRSTNLMVADSLPGFAPLAISRQR